MHFRALRGKTFVVLIAELPCGGHEALAVNDSLVWCLRSSLHNSIVIPGNLATASATRNPGKSNASGCPLLRA